MGASRRHLPLGSEHRRFHVDLAYLLHRMALAVNPRDWRCSAFGGQPLPPFLSRDTWILILYDVYTLFIRCLYFSDSFWFRLCMGGVEIEIVSQSLLFAKVQYGHLSKSH